MENLKTLFYKIKYKRYIALFLTMAILFTTVDFSNFFTEIELNGTGNVYTNTVNGIDGNINGTGNLYYKATKTVNVTENGNGKAEKY